MIHLITVRYITDIRHQWNASILTRRYAGAVIVNNDCGWYDSLPPCNNHSEQCNVPVRRGGFLAALASTAVPVDMVKSAHALMKRVPKPRNIPYRPWSVQGWWWPKWTLEPWGQVQGSRFKKALKIIHININFRSFLQKIEQLRIIALLENVDSSKQWSKYL